MTIFHLDFEGGNDANDGTTFANRWKTLTNGATAARIAPGDTIRVMASPDPVDTGMTATVRSFLNPVAQAYTAATNASPIAITKTAHGLATGDIIGVYGDTVNTAANGLWRVTVVDVDHFSLDNSTGNGVGTSGSFMPMNTCVFTLSAAQTQNIAVTPTESSPIVPNWTASTNVTSSVLTVAGAVGGVAGINLSVAAGFTTGKAAYYTLPATLNLSGYQQVSFMLGISSTIPTTTASWLRVCLCSDSAGATPVHQITVPTPKFCTSVMQEIPVTWDNGSALSSTINSISVYIDTDYGAITLQLSNFVACKASNNASTITHSTLLGKNATEGFFSLGFINGTTVTLRTPQMKGLSAKRTVYCGGSGTFNLYKVNPISLPITATGVGDCIGSSMAVMDSGTSGNPITISFGWNRTDMTTQTGDTYLDGRGHQPCALWIEQSYINIDKGSFVRFVGGVFNRRSNNNVHINNMNCVGASGSQYDALSVYDGGATSVVENVSVQFNNISGSAGCSIQGARKVVVGGNSPAIWGSWDATKSIKIYDSKFVTINGLNVIANAGAVTLQLANSVTFNNLLVQKTLSVNAVVEADVNFNVQFNGGGIESRLSAPSSAFTLVSTGVVDNCIVLNNVASISEAALTFPNVSAVTAANESSIRHENVGGVSTDNRIYKIGGTIKSDTTTRHSASGIAWKFSPTSTFRTSANPLELPLGAFGVSASALVTAKLWVYRDNAGIEMQFVCRTQEKMGITSESRASCSGVAAWEQLTITFTPNKSGVIELFAEAWGGTTYNAWIDDLTITQA